MTKIYIVFYSMYGHVKKMAEEVKAGCEKVKGVEVTLWQVPETLPAEVLEKMHAPPHPWKDVPVITAADLEKADAVMFGIPTRFGMMAAQMKAFFDSCGQLWTKGALIGKPAGIFFSTATQNGGQETTALTAVTQLTHLGMIFVPMGYSTPLLFGMDEVRGGSPYGAGTFAGPDGSRQPSATEIKIAVHHGEHFAKIASALAKGKELTHA